MMPLDNFGSFFKDTSNIIIFISSIVFIISYITLKTIDTTNKTGLFSLKFFSYSSIIILILSIILKFFPVSLVDILKISFGYIIMFFMYIYEKIIILFNFGKQFIGNFFKSLVDILFQIMSFTTTNYMKILMSLLVCGIIGVIIFLMYHFDIITNKYDTDLIKIFSSIGVFALLLTLSWVVIPKLYSPDGDAEYKISLAIAFGVMISMVLALFYINEIFNGNYTNYGTVMFNALIFIAFIYILFGIKQNFFDIQSSTTPNTYSTMESFLYYYLFPICFFIGYVMYYIYIYKHENLSYTDVSDYRVIIFNILSIILLLYIIYQCIKKIFSNSTIPPIFNYISRFFNNYVSPNPLGIATAMIFSLFFVLFIYFIANGGISVSYDSWYMILIEIIGIIAFISGIIKILLLTTKLGESKVFQLLQKTLLLLPCLFLIGLDGIFKGTKFGTASELLFIALIVFFILFYNSLTTAIIPDLYEKYILRDGNQLIDKPVPLDEYKFVSSYGDLFNFNNETESDNPNKFDYRYGLSFWVYINSFPPINSELYDICCLGDGLMIKYNPVENTLYFMYVGVSVNKNDGNKQSLTSEDIEQWKTHKKNIEGFKKMTSPTIETNPTEIIIHKEKNIRLQKWNNIIINYNAGTMDIFINGKMIKTQINVAPYVKNTALTVGKSDGIKGDICNLIYYKSPMSKTEIYRMYNIFKNKNPPVINKKDTDFINFGETMEVYFSEWFTKIKM
jgi:hypothetical protein